MDTAAAGSELRFSTDVLPPSERLPYLREVIGRFVVGLDLSPVAGEPLKSAGRMHLFDGLAVTSAEVTGLLARRTRSLLANSSSDDLVFATNLSGFSLVSEGDRECRLDAGSAVLLSTAEPGVHDFPDR